MHEMGMAQEIIRIVSSILEEHPGKQLKKVFVKIGEFAAVVPDSLKFSYQALIAETPLQGSELVIEIVPITAECQNCHKTFGISQFEFHCPYCQSTQINLKSGDELRISELEVD